MSPFLLSVGDRRTGNLSNVKVSNVHEMKISHPQSERTVCNTGNNAIFEKLDECLPIKRCN